MSLEIDITHRLGGFLLQARFESDGPITALFGRSGAGKTSLVNVIAGIIRPTQGRVALDGQVLLDTAQGVFVPMHKRRIGYVFQEGRLFPHLTVRQNLLYGRWFAKEADPAERLETLVELLGIASLLNRRPAALSGGEKQRVAIGRALLAGPRLLLMDEPLASLDEPRKAEILPYIERLRDATRVPIVYVSHTVEEVARLASTLVVMSGGRIEAAGPAADIIARLDLFSSEDRAEVGAILEARVAAQDPQFQLTLLEARAGRLAVPRLEAAIGTILKVRVRARDVMLAIRRPEGLSAQNILDGVITAIGVANRPVVEVRIDCHGDTVLAQLTQRAIHDLGLVPGRAVHVVLKSVAFDRASLGGLRPGAEGNAQH
ncbi:MAG: molybdenum ABC transporter ATP-binding protein [Proteobacteria bacterium]|nr:molybdenum ABC transporter ATP-binding protein [Pseudomonadota bacterium]